MIIGIPYESKSNGLNFDFWPGWQAKKQKQKVSRRNNLGWTIVKVILYWVGESRGGRVGKKKAIHFQRSLNFAGSPQKWISAKSVTFGGDPLMIHHYIPRPNNDGAYTNWISTKSVANRSGLNIDGHISNKTQYRRALYGSFTNYKLPGHEGGNQSHEFSLIKSFSSSLKTMIIERLPLFVDSHENPLLIIPMHDIFVISF